MFDVKVSGEQEINGVPTTHYVGTIDLKKVLKGFSDVVGKDADAATKEQLIAAWRELVLGWSTDTRLTIADGSRHIVQLDRPDLIVDAVRRLVDRARSGS